jgi:hypothetical protein
LWQGRYVNVCGQAHATAKSMPKPLFFSELTETSGSMKNISKEDLCSLRGQWLLRP